MRSDESTVPNSSIVSAWIRASSRRLSSSVVASRTSTMSVWSIVPSRISFAGSETAGSEAAGSRAVPGSASGVSFVSVVVGPSLIASAWHRSETKGFPGGTSVLEVMEMRSEVDIDRPVDEVFAVIADMSRNPEWQKGMTSCTWTTEPPIRVGSTYDQVASFMGKEILTTFQVTEYDAPTRIRIESVVSTFPLDITRTVEARDGGAHVTAVVRGAPGGPDEGLRAAHEAPGPSVRSGPTTSGSRTCWRPDRPGFSRAGRIRAPGRVPRRSVR